MLRTRQEEILSTQILKDQEVIMIGAGAVGSCTSLLLGKMGIPRITIYDPDIVEEHNIPNQFFRMGDIGVPKVVALGNILSEFTDAEVTGHVNKFTSPTRLPEIVISAVDSIEAREDIWGKIKSLNSGKWYIDSRMGGETGEIYIVRTRLESKEYEETLWPSDEVSQIRCTARSIIYNAMGLASIICATVKNILVGEKVPFQRIVDFKMEKIFNIPEEVIMMDSDIMDE